MIFCCDGIALPLAALRATSWRWVKNVVLAMMMMAMTVTVFTVDGVAPIASAFDAVLNPSASGTPKTFAWPAVHNELADQPYCGWKPACLDCSHWVQAEVADDPGSAVKLARADPPCSAM